MSGSKELHRGHNGRAGVANGRFGATPVPALEAVSFLGYRRAAEIETTPSRPTHPPLTTNVVGIDSRRPAISAESVRTVNPMKSATAAISTTSEDLAGRFDDPSEVSALAPTVRVAILHLGESNFDSTVSLAVALAEEAATGTHAAGGLVTVAADHVRAGTPRRRRSISLRGFQPIGRCGSVTLLDASDAESASIAAAGMVPIVCVLRPCADISIELRRICPSSVLIAADSDVDRGYLELLASDVGRSCRSSSPRVLRYSDRTESNLDAPALSADRSAALRLRLALPPGRHSRANAEIAAAMLARA